MAECESAIMVECEDSIKAEIPVRAGYLAIKKEFLLNVEEKPDVKPDENVEQKPEVQNDNGDGPKRFRGMNKKRRKEMSNARSEIRKHEVNLCVSVVVPEKKCRFGENCRYEHSLEDYMKLKAPDLGDRCPNYELMGQCPYGVACRFASAHTNEDFSQKTKDPDPSYLPVMNVKGDLQFKLRRREYDFSKVDEACKKYANPAPENPPIGAMEREKLKLDMRSLKGKTYLAPLTTVGNLPFRRLCVDLGAEITCGEMAVATSFLGGSNNEWPLLKRHPSEKIFGVQLAGGFPDTLGKAAQMITENMEVDFIDINLGCPIDLICDKGGGCTLGNRPTKLISVVRTLQDVMGEIPLTLKMRYGLKIGEKTSHTIMKKIADSCPPQLITLHPRSKEQRYTKEADWNYVPQCLEAVDKKIPFWVCGDVYSHEDYYNRLENYDIDGIMIGRAALIKPWIFTEIAERRHWDISASERLDYARKFVDYGLEYWGSDNAGVETTRRFLLEWLSFTHRYVPIGLLEHLSPKMNQKPPPYFGRSDLETLLSSRKASDWVKISEMFLGKTPEGFLFVPKHKANSY